MLEVHHRSVGDHVDSVPGQRLAVTETLDHLHHLRVIGNDGPPVARGAAGERREAGLSLGLGTRMAARAGDLVVHVRLVAEGDRLGGRLWLRRASGDPEQAHERQQIDPRSAHDGQTIGRARWRVNPLGGRIPLVVFSTPVEDPPHFHHGLLGDGRSRAGSRCSAIPLPPDGPLRLSCLDSQVSPPFGLS